MRVFRRQKRAKFHRPVRLLQQLEDRIVLDASGSPANNDNPPDQAGSTGDGANPTSTASQAGQTSTGAEALIAAPALPDNLNQVFGTDLNVVLISSAVDHIDALAAAAVDGAKVIVYDAKTADLSTINSVLENVVNSAGQKIDHLAFVTHGEPGFFELSASQDVNPVSVLSHPGSWHELGTLLDTGARIDLYGCNTGQGPMGLFLVSAISHETGAAVWASNDTTGNVGSADWNLEIRCGESALPPLITESALDGTPISLGYISQGWANACVWNWHTQFTIDDGHMAGCDYGWIGLEAKGDIDGYQSGFFDHYAVQGEYVHFTIGNKTYDLTANSVDHFYAYTELGDGFLNDMPGGSLYCRIDITEFTVETKEAYYWGGYCYDSARDGNWIYFGMTWNDKPYTHTEGTPEIVVNEDDPAGIVINLGTYFHDVEDADNLTYSCQFSYNPLFESAPVIDGGTLTWHPRPNAYGYELITVTATDHGYGSGTVPLSEQLSFWLVINPVNDAPTDISLSPSSVNEAQPAGTLVGSFSVTDQDGGANTTYSLVPGSGGADNGSFTISDGKLYTAAPLNFEAKSSYNILVQVDDGSGGIFQKAMVVSAIDLPETAPSGISLSNHAIAENEPIGTSVGVFTTTDPDPGDSHTYSLVAGDGSGDNASFTITGTTLKTSERFNYEAKNTYDIRVRTTDFTGLSYEEAMTIFVTDVDEPPALVLNHGAGALDLTFDGDGKVTTDFGYPYQEAHAVAVQSDGKIIAGGRVSYSDSPPYSWGLVRYNSDGTLDNTFDTDGKTLTNFGDASKVNDLVIQPDGKIVAVGSAYYQGWNFGIARYNTNGSLDTSFNFCGQEMVSFGTHWAQGYSVAIQSDGKILMAGSSLDTGANMDFALVRLESDGRLDTSFGVGGKLTTDLGVTGSTEMNVSMAIRPDGKIVVVGRSNNDFAVACYNSNGTLDSSFDPIGHDGIVTTDFGYYDSAYSVAIQPDGKIVVAGGNFGNYLVARYNDDGRLDGTLDGDGKVTIPGPWASSVAIQPDGKIILAGPDSSTSNIVFGVARLNSDGSLDGTFGAHGRLTTGFGAGPYCPPAQPFAVDIQPDGKVIVAGTASLGAEYYYFATARYDCGHLDYLEGSGPQVIDGGVTLTDSDGTLASATIQITGSYFTGEDHLDINVATVPGVTVSGQGTGTLTLTGTVSVADYQNMLQHVTYENSDNDPHTAPRTVTWTVNDGSFDALQEGTIAVIPVNEPPMISDVSSLEYTENDGPKIIDSDITLLDPDSSDMVSATIRITGDYHNDQDILRIEDGDRLGGVVSSWDASTGTLTLAGLTSKANYESMLEHVRYINSSDDPNANLRTVTWTVTDSALASSAPQTSSISVIAVNDAPTDITLSGSTVAENQLPETVVGTFTSTDPDSGDTSTYSLVSGTGDTDNASFTIVGNTLQSEAPFDYETKNSYSIRVRTTDSGGLWHEEAFTIGVTDVNDAPTDLSLTPSTVNENLASGTLVGDFGVTDQDAGPLWTYTLVSGAGDGDNGSFTITDGKLYTDASFDFETKSTYNIRVQVSDGNGGVFEKAVVVGVLDVNDAPTDLGLTPASVNENLASGTLVGDFNVTDQDGGPAWTYTLVSGAGDADNGSFTVSDGKLYTDASFDFETKSTYNVRVQVSDGNGGVFEKPLVVSILDVNDAPVLSGLNGTLAYTENVGVLVIDSDMTLSDQDSTTISSATVEIAGNYESAHDTLTIDSGDLRDGVTAVYDSGTGRLTLTGPTTLANYEHMLEHVKYYNNSENSSTLSRTVTWTVNDGLADSAPQTSTITVTAINDAPQTTVPGSPITFEGSFTFGGSLTVADVDAESDSIRMTLTASHGNLAVVSIPGLILTGNGTHTLVVEGGQSLINTALNGLTYTPDAGAVIYAGTDTVQVVTSDLGHNGNGGILTDTDTIDLNVNLRNVGGVDYWVVNMVTAGSYTAQDRNELVNGTSGDDTIDATGLNNRYILYGGDGNDSLYSSTGADSLHGGTGDDILILSGLGGQAFGESGNDNLYAVGSASGNTLNGGDGSDGLAAYDTANNNVLNGQDGTGGGTDADSLSAFDSASDNTLNGDGGDDVVRVSGMATGNTLNGDGGVDVLAVYDTANHNMLNGHNGAGGGTDTDYLYAYGNAYVNTLNGDGGGDVLLAYDTANNNVLNGHDGTGGGTEKDTFYAYGNAYVNTLNGEGGDDLVQVYGNASGNTVSGGGGSDAMAAFGTAHGNSLNGHDGAGGGTDTDYLYAYGNAYVNTLNGDGGGDSLLVYDTANNNVLNGHGGTGGGTEKDTFYAYGNAYVNTLNGEGGGDTLMVFGTAHNNILNGHDGAGGGTDADSLSAFDSASNNTLNGDGGDDVVRVSGLASGNIVNGGGGVDVLAVYDTANNNVLNGHDGTGGGTDTDYLYAYGNAYGNTLNGDGGGDSLLVYDTANNNVLNGHNGSGGGTEKDTFYAYGNAYVNTLNGEGGGDTLMVFGTAHNNILNGHDGAGGGTDADSLSAFDSASNNTLNGDGGDDVVRVSGLASGNTVNGGGGVDVLAVYDTANNNVLNGDNGAGGGTDTDYLYAYGNAYGNTLNGDGGGDSLLVYDTANNNVLNGHNGSGGGTEKDTFYAYGNAYGNTLNGEGGGDTLMVWGTANNNVLNGGAGDDTLSGNGSTVGNTYFGGVGADDITGGTGDDLIAHGATLSVSSDGSRDTIRSGGGTDTIYSNRAPDHDGVS